MSLLTFYLNQYLYDKCFLSQLQVINMRILCCWVIVWIGVHTSHSKTLITCLLIILSVAINDSPTFSFFPKLANQNMFNNQITKR